ncbi:unnamed protein product [Heligmosomoides polygyrus]|uniref:Protein kinase domain-containing protein n=1 Tax=Heligmosomoides polygyrus TaxID=6339 RepID=A0A183FS04_HELPZ|nr:unnamed protein product [Heligmosomoides polygyrus]
MRILGICPHHLLKTLQPSGSLPDAHHLRLKDLSGVGVHFSEWETFWVAPGYLWTLQRLLPSQDKCFLCSDPLAICLLATTPTSYPTTYEMHQVLCRQLALRLPCPSNAPATPSNRAIRRN